jgi:hypothetical protein
MEMTRLVTKLLGPPEQIDTLARFPGHLHRWMIFGTQNFKVYLHHSFNEDLNLDLCNYPRRFISLGIANSHIKDSASALKALSERAAWMVLIAKSSGAGEEGTLD